MSKGLTAFVMMTLAVGLLYPTSARGEADPLLGVFRDDKITLTVSKGKDGYTGTVAMGSNSFPLTASTTKDGKELTGKFTNEGKPFSFTAQLNGDTLVFKTGSAS